jgi:hypothetical protein
MALKDIVPGIAAGLQGRAAMPIEGGVVEMKLDELPALALIPFYCDLSVQYAVHVRGKAKLDKKALKVKFTGLFEVDGEYALAIPGDGIMPPLRVGATVATAIAAAAPPGTRIELRTANLGKVTRDRTVKAETVLASGNQRYAGELGEGGVWRIDHAYPAVTALQLAGALEIGRTVLAKGPWRMRDRDEAAATVRGMLDSRTANINDHFVKQAVRVDGSSLVLWPVFDREPSKHFALGMALFRRRFADGPWDIASGLAQDKLGMTTEDQKDEIMNTVLGNTSS